MGAPTISDQVSANFVSPGTTQSVGNLTVGAGTQMIVAVIGSSAGDPIAAGGVAKVDGVSMALAINAVGHAIFYLDDLTGVTTPGACTVDFASGGYRAAVTFYALDHPTPLVFIDADSASGDGFPGPVSVPGLSGTTTDAIGIGCCENNGFFVGALDLGPDLVQDHSHDIASIRIKTFHDVTSPATAHASNHSDHGTLAIALAMFGPAPDPDLAFDPDAFGVEVGFQSGIALVVEDDVLLGPRAFGLEAGFQAGLAFGATGSRQVMLTGEGIETPEMTEGGTDGYFLRFNAGSKPSWEEVTGGGGGGSIRVREADSSPNVSPVDTIVVPNGSLTDLGGGDVQLTFAASIDFGEDADITTAAFGDAPDAGATGEVADAGHTHGMMANPVTAHEAASDPHPGYLTPTEGDAAYSALGHSHTGLPLDFGEAGDIGASAPGDAAAAGATGEIADAGHVHPRLGETFALEVFFDGGGVALTTGHKLDVECPFAFTIQQWTILGDPAGAIVIDIWVDTYANYPPTNADSITASAKPTVSATNAKGQSSSIGTWTSAGAIAAGSTMRFNIDSITSMTRATLSLKCVRT